MAVSIHQDELRKLFVIASNKPNGVFTRWPFIYSVYNGKPIVLADKYYGELAMVGSGYLVSLGKADTTDAKKLKTIVSRTTKNLIESQ